MHRALSYSDSVHVGILELCMGCQQDVWILPNISLIIMQESRQRYKLGIAAGNKLLKTQTFFSTLSLSLSLSLLAPREPNRPIADA